MQLLHSGIDYSVIVHVQHFTIYCRQHENDGSPECEP